MGTAMKSTNPVIDTVSGSEALGAPPLKPLPLLKLHKKCSQNTHQKISKYFLLRIRASLSSRSSTHLDEI